MPVRSKGRNCCSSDHTGRFPPPLEEKEAVLEAMRKAGEPLNAGKVAELTGLDRKVVGKVFTALKKEGLIVSPVRCKWEPAQK